MTDASKKPAKSDRTRAAILSAAQDLFADQGYERTTVRDIAAQAGIDPALVIRYFGSKEGLFARAALFDLQLPDLRRVDPTERGSTLVRPFLGLWEGERANGGLAILLRSAASNPLAAEKLKEVFAGQVLPTLAQAVGTGNAAEQAGLVSSQLLGLALCRYVLKLPPVVDMPSEHIVRDVGPTIQRYLSGCALSGRDISD